MNLQSTDFELFEVEARFAQDRQLLDARWKDLQRQAHPDRFATQGAAAQRIAMQWSVRINEAYQRLKDPLRRAAYLCELGGVAIDARNNTAMEPAFLQQQLEWREALDEATNPAALEQLRTAVSTKQAAVLSGCEQMLDVTHDYQGAAVQVRRLMFFQSFLRELQARADGMEMAVPASATVQAAGQ